MSCAWTFDDDSDHFHIGCTDEWWQNVGAEWPSDLPSTFCPNCGQLIARKWNGLRKSDDEHDDTFDDEEDAL